MLVEKLSGEMISPGAAKGRLLFFESDYSLSGADSRKAADNVEQQIARFEDHIDYLEAELAEVIAALEEESAYEEAEILRTHIYLIKDPKFHNEVRREIIENRRAAEAAIEFILHRMIEAFERSRNELFLQRANDVRDILSRLSRRVNQQSREAFEALRGTGATVLAMRELLPSIVLEARHSSVVGFVVERGSGLSHAAILAKSLGFPTIRTDEWETLRAMSEEEVLVDGTNGYILVAPDADAVVESLDSAVSLCERDEGEMPARLWVNIADPAQVSPDLLKSVEGVGLYRTEVLFMEQAEDFPSEQRQYEVYRRLFEQCHPDCPITIRTADIGGDKTLSYFTLESRGNPYLGVRALRVYREHPEIFIIQMRAILRAAVNASGLRVMYPMIASLEDLHFLQRLVAQVIRSLEARGDPYQHDFQQGIMIEVPSAAWSCEELLAAVDFASVGTNDLLQYFFAVSRDDAEITQGYRALDPVALQMLKRIVDVAARVRKPLGLCGEIASDPKLVPLLVGLGFRDLSVDIHFLSQVQQVVASLDVAACERLAEECLKAKNSQEVRKLLSESTVTRNPGGNGSASRPGRTARLVPETTLDSSTATVRKGHAQSFRSPRCSDTDFYRELRDRGDPPATHIDTAATPHHVGHT